AKAMLPRVRASKRSPESKRMMIQFVESAIVAQFPNLSRQEVEKMLQVDDLRQTRVYQEGVEEGRTEGRTEGRAEERAEIAQKLLELKHPIAEIAKVTGLTQAQIRKLKKKPAKD